MQAKRKIASKPKKETSTANSTNKLQLVSIKKSAEPSLVSEPVVETDSTTSITSQQVIANVIEPFEVNTPVLEATTITSVSSKQEIEKVVEPQVSSPVGNTVKKVLKPVKKAIVNRPTIDENLPENENAIFQGIGVIVGNISFIEKKAFVKIGEKEYNLFYSSSHKKAFEALKLHVKKTGVSNLRLIVYPKIMHFPKREQPYFVGFQLVGFRLPDTQNENKANVDQELQDFEFKLSGLWQFIPVCQVPCITVQKNFSEERLTYIKEAPIEQKVNFMKASHVPVMWKDAPIRPFRFNPRLDKEEQGQASFIEIKATFVPDEDIFQFKELRSKPKQESPKFLKAGKKQKADALKAKTQRKKEQTK